MPVAAADSIPQPTTVFELVNNMLTMRAQAAQQLKEDQDAFDTEFDEWYASRQAEGLPLPAELPTETNKMQLMLQILGISVYSQGSMILLCSVM